MRWQRNGILREEVRIEPSKGTARVRSVEVHGRSLESAVAGQRVALNLAGVDRRQVERGDVVAGADELRGTHLVDAAVELLPGAGSLRRGARVQVHHGTRASAGRIAPLEAEVLEPQRRAYVQIRLERPIVPAAGDRLVLRQVAPPDTIGGGVVIDPAPRKHGPGPEHVERLRLLESGGPLEQLEAELASVPSGLGDEESDVELLEQLRAGGRAIRIGIGRPRYFAPAQLERARLRLLAALSETRDGRPASRGALADRAGISDSAAQAILEHLQAEGDVVTRGPGFSAPAKGTEADPLARRLVELLRDDLLAPRGLEALATELGTGAAEARELAERATLEGALERLKPGLYYHPAGLREAERLVRPRGLGHDRPVAGRARNEPEVRAGLARALRCHSAHQAPRGRASPPPPAGLARYANGRRVG